MEWCCKLLIFSSLFNEVALAVREDNDVFEVKTGVVMPHSISILSGSTFNVSIPVNVFVDGVVAALLFPINNKIKNFNLK